MATKGGKSKGAIDVKQLTAELLKAARQLSAQQARKPAGQRIALDTQSLVRLASASPALAGLALAIVSPAVARLAAGGTAQLSQIAKVRGGRGRRG